MILVKLTAKSRKGKNRIREQGELWELVKTQDTVLFSDQKGPWHLVMSCKNESYIRWVHETNDPDFSFSVSFSVM